MHWLLLFLFQTFSPTCLFQSSEKVKTNHFALEEKTDFDHSNKNYSEEQVAKISVAFKDSTKDMNS